MTAAPSGPRRSGADALGTGGTRSRSAARPGLAASGTAPHRLSGDGRPPRSSGRPARLDVPLGAAIALVGLVRCGDGGAEPPASPTETELAELCEELAVADCARLDACGFLGPGIDRARCEERQATVLCAPYARALGRAEQGGEGTWLAAAGRRCVEAVGSPGCLRGFAYDLLAIDACRAAFLPRATAGGPCSYAGSCVEGTFCDVSGSCPGSCEPFAGVNQTCGGRRPCGPGLHCALVGRVCLPVSDLGAECEVVTRGSSCRAGTFCDDSQPGPARCVEARGRGGGCERDAQCAVGLRCIANRCSAGEAGDACVDDRDCTADRRCSGRVCSTPGGLGDPCAALADCAVGLGCATSGCALGLTSGAACGPDAPCASGRCEGGVCRARAADGADCDATEDCLEGRACVDGVCRPVGPYCPL